MKEHKVAVIGGGQAGVSLSYYLKKRKIDHIVFEREQAFSSWWNRWDGFRTNTPNWMNTLPFVDAAQLPSGDADAFGTSEEVTDYLKLCLEAVDPPMVTGVEVDRVKRSGDGSWLIETNEGRYRTSSTAICSGAMSLPRIPALSSDIPGTVPQFHSSIYRSPDQITTGSVLIVGAASSGVQICRLLCESGKFERVYVAQSEVMVLPKHILGIPIHRFINYFGLFDVRTHSPLGKLLFSGIRTQGDPVMRPSANDLKKNHGVELLGKLAGFDGRMLCFEGGRELTLDDLTIVWCTGFKPDFDFIEFEDKDAAFDATGYPRHSRGVVDTVPGLYFVGLRYQHTVTSHDIYGVARDAEFIAASIHKQLEHLTKND